MRQRNSSAKKGPRNIEPVDFDEIDKFHKQREKILFDGNDSNEDLEFENEALDPILDVDDSEDEEDAPFVSNDEGNESEEEVQSERWGKSKKNFYAADDAAEEEEVEALRLQKVKLSGLKSQDFHDDFEVTGKTKRINVQLNEERELLSESEASDDILEDFGKTASKEEQLELITKHSPELAVILNEFKTKYTDVKSLLSKYADKFSDENQPSSPGLSFLDAKVHLLLAYCANISYYLLLKVQGKSVKDHPVLDRLAKYRLLIEKIRPLEAKLKYQIDKLQHAATQSDIGAVESIDELTYRARPDSFVAENDSMDEADGTYHVPKIAPVFYNDEKNETENRRKYEDKQLAKASRSRLAQELKDEFGDMPEEEDLDVTHKRSFNKESKKGADIDRFEEDNFTRLMLSKKEKQKMKKAGLVDELEALNDFFHDVDNGNDGRKPLSKQLLSLGSKKRKSQSADADFPRKSEKKRVQKDVNESSANEVESMSEIEDDTEDFYKNTKKAHSARASQKHERPLVKFRPIVDLQESSGRPASYTMLKNKGITPSRNKEQRNPRVRQKKKFERAVNKLGSFRPNMRDGSGKYGGESTGIRTNLSRSVKL